MGVVFPVGGRSGKEAAAPDWAKFVAFLPSGFIPVTIRIVNGGGDGVDMALSVDKNDFRAQLTSATNFSWELASVCKVKAKEASRL